MIHVADKDHVLFFPVRFRDTRGEAACSIGNVSRAEIAQLVEHIHGKDEVVGSIPTLGSRGIDKYIYVL